MENIYRIEHDVFSYRNDPPNTQRGVFIWMSSCCPLLSFHFFPAPSCRFPSCPPFLPLLLGHTLYFYSEWFPKSVVFHYFFHRNTFSLLSIKVYLCFNFLYLPLKFVMVLLPITLGLPVTAFVERILSTVAMILCFVLSKNKRKITSIEINRLLY